MTNIKILSQYSEKTKVKLKFTKPSLTKQSQLESTDINKILNKYQKTGTLPILQSPQKYEDYSDVVSFQEAQNILIHANEQFEGLDSKIRERFNNNPENFLEFVNNSENKEEMYKLGLAIKPTTQTDITNTGMNPDQNIADGNGEANSEASGEA